MSDLFAAPSASTPEVPAAALLPLAAAAALLWSRRRSRTTSRVTPR